ncbi:MAG: superoxide dismutase, Ni [Patescibacteria group bacterium]
MKSFIPHIKLMTSPVRYHCDLPCGVYNPVQARIEAESVLAIIKKYHDSDDEIFKQRAIIIKEHRSHLAKEHLWTLWSDYFKPEHLEKYPNLHKLFWDATKACSKLKASIDIKDAEQLIKLIDEIDEIFQETKK